MANQADADRAEVDRAIQALDRALAPVLLRAIVKEPDEALERWTEWANALSETLRRVKPMTGYYDRESFNGDFVVALAEHKAALLQKDQAPS